MKETKVPSMIASIMKKRGESSTDNEPKPKKRFSSMRKKLGERTGLSLLRRNRRNHGKRYVKHSPFSRTHKQQFHGAEKEEEKEVVVCVSPSATLDTEEDTGSPPSLTIEGSNVHPMDHFSGVAPTGTILDTPLSDIQGQALFKSPAVEPEKQSSNKCAPRPKKSVHFDFQQEEYQEDKLHYIPLSSLSEVSPRTLEAIIETTNIDSDEGSWSSSSEGDEHFHVSFSPAKDLFLRTLAMERATALSMSEMALEASESHIDTKTRNLSGVWANVKSSIREFAQRFTLNDVLGLAVVVMVLLEWSGVTEYIVSNVQAVVEASWRAGLARFGYSSRVAAHRSNTLYDHQQDPMGAWLVR
jgi:hypothetical protein